MKLAKYVCDENSNMQLLQQQQVTQQTQPNSTTSTRSKPHNRKRSKARHKISEDDMLIVESMKNADVSLLDIARHFRVSASTITRRWKKKHNLPWKKGHTEEASERFIAGPQISTEASTKSFNGSQFLSSFSNSSEMHAEQAQQHAEKAVEQAHLTQQTQQSHHPQEAQQRQLEQAPCTPNHRLEFQECASLGRLWTNFANTPGQLLFANTPGLLLNNADLQMPSVFPGGGCSSQSPTSQYLPSQTSVDRQLHDICDYNSKLQPPLTPNQQHLQHKFPGSARGFEAEIEKANTDLNLPQSLLSASFSSLHANQQFRARTPSRTPAQNCGADKQSDTGLPSLQIVHGVHSPLRFYETPCPTR